MVRPEVSFTRWYMDHDERVAWLFNDIVEMGVIMKDPDSSHCTWLQGVRMVRDGDIMRRWRVAYVDGVSWFSDDIDGYHRASVGAFTRFQMSRHDYVGWISVFSIGHVRSWKHDVRGFGQKMGGHHFHEPIYLSPSHIELPVASPLSIARAS